MNGKICMVTGANAGIGKVTARELAKMGAHVVMVCRRPERGEAAKKEVEQTATGQVDLMIADLSSQVSIRALAAAYLETYDRLDVLVNNAGAMFMKRSESVDGLEMTFALNHMGYFLLTNLLLDRIKASTPSRIVNVSSDMHRRGTIDFDDLQAEKKYAGMDVYGNSKLANVLFTTELARRLEGTAVTVNCLHPGFVRSNFGKNNSGFMKIVMPIIQLFAINKEKGAETSVYLASSSEVAGVTGQYFEKKKEVTPSEAAQETAVAERLWQTSEALLN